MPKIKLSSCIFVIFVTSFFAANTFSAQDKDHIEPIVAEIEDLLLQQSSNYPGTAKISINASRLEKLPVCDDFSVSLPGSQRLRPRMSVNVRCYEPNSWTGRVQAIIAIEGYFYVAARTLSPGDVINLDDLIPREGNLLSMANSVVIDPSLLIDHIVTQRIANGSPIKTNAIRNPLSVMRGQVVRIEVSGPGFTITSDGQTLEEGKPGQQIRVKTSSGQVISAIVVNANTVMIPM